MKILADVKGFENIKRIFDSIGFTLSASQVRGILDGAGKVILKEAKNDVEFTGEIADDFKKDLAVYRDNRKSEKNKEYIIIGPRFKQYTIHGQPQKVALIAQHLTQGFQQSERFTSKGQKRGKVKDQKINPMAKAYKTTKDEAQLGMDKAIKKKLEVIKSKHPELVK